MAPKSLPRLLALALALLVPLGGCKTTMPDEGPAGPEVDTAGTAGAGPRVGTRGAPSLSASACYALQTLDFTKQTPEVLERADAFGNGQCFAGAQVYFDALGVQFPREVDSDGVPDTPCSPRAGSACQLWAKHVETLADAKAHGHPRSYWDSGVWEKIPWGTVEARIGDVVVFQSSAEAEDGHLAVVNKVDHVAGQAWRLWVRDSNWKGDKATSYHRIRLYDNQTCQPTAYQPKGFFRRKGYRPIVRYCDGGPLMTCAPEGNGTLIREWCQQPPFSLDDDVCAYRCQKMPTGTADYCCGSTGEKCCAATDRPPCASGNRCWNGVCTSCIQCTAGTSECVGTTRSRTCTKDASGCTAWTTTACASTQICLGGACVSSACVNQVCTPGASRCILNEVQRCVRDAQGCGIWSTPTIPCESQQCVNGACVTCKDQCTLGAVRCSGNDVQKCVRSTTGCTVWSADLIPCGSTQTCINGACADCRNQCTAGSTRCNGNAVQRCITGSVGCTVWASQTSPCDPQTCQNGACVSSGPSCQNDCTAGSARCSGNSVQPCILGGSGCYVWSTQTTACDLKTCQNGSCVSTCQNQCTPGASQCVGNDVQKCVPGTNGCYVWSTNLIPCEGMTCMNGTCK